MNLQFWPGAVIMMLIATITVSLVTNSGRSAWFVGVLVLLVYLIFAMTLYLLPPGSCDRSHPSGLHVTPNPCGCCRQRLQHCHPCVFDGGCNVGGAHRGCDYNVPSIASIDCRHDCDRVVPDGRTSCEVLVWALAYAIVGVAPQGTDLIYFSFVNYTTLGYGDVTLTERWHLLGPMTAMNGVLLFAGQPQ